MAKTEPDLIHQIDEAQERITSQFLHQCAHGAQTKRLPSEFAACGQFIAGEAEGIPQLGLHGISAALRVLGPCHTPECGAIVNRLVAYCNAVFGVNQSLPIDPKNGLKPEDTRNVIKLGELLYGLSFVTTAQAEKETLIRHIADQLLRSVHNNKGWGYLLGDNSPQPLPTAYALRGLAQNGFPTSGPRQFLLEGVGIQGQAAPASHVDLMTAVAVTYCLTFCGDISEEQKTVLKQVFVSKWRALEPFFGEDIEQNLEYCHGAITEYVRIPFQLYLLALAAEYRIWYFASYHAQRSLHAVLNALRDGSFKYPYSGDYLSSRTNSIAFDVIILIRERMRHRTFLHIASVADRVRVFAGSRMFRGAAALIAFIIIIWCILDWSKAGKAADLAPELLSNALVLLVAFGRRHS